LTANLSKTRNFSQILTAKYCKIGNFHEFDCKSLQNPQFSQISPANLCKIKIFREFYLQKTARPAVFLLTEKYCSKSQNNAVKWL